MNVEEIVAEMRLKPDAQVLIEWIDERVLDPGGELRTEIGRAITAYYIGLEKTS